MRFAHLLLALAAVCLCGPVVAQPSPSGAENPTFIQPPALRGGYFQISSKETGHSYHIHIRLPEGYDPNRATRYPVAYILDGDSLFPILAATHLFLSIDDSIPEAIVIGIGYGGFDPAINKRGIDFMPPGTGSPGTSGAPMFRRFLKAELLPAIEGRYHADPARRILFGQSRGGSFAIYAALTEPGLFWGSIANNPALAPTRDFFYGEPASTTRTDATLIVTNGTRDRPDLRADTTAWLADRKKKRGSDPWTLRGVTIQNGTHSANSADAYRAAMRILFGRQDK